MANSRFNQAKHNLSSFNTRYVRSRVLSLSMDVESKGNIDTNISGIFVLSLFSKAVASASARIIMQVSVIGETTGNGEMTAKLIRFTRLSGHADSKSLEELRIRLYKIMEYLDVLKTGDILEIDTANFSVKLNGVNVYDKFKGDFIKISDKTQIIYEDTESTRDIELTVNYTEKYY